MRRAACHRHGTRAPAAFPLAAGSIPYTLASADFNRDGKLDLAVAGAQSNDVSILLGDGSGVFGAPTVFAVGTFPDWLAIGDLNGDGKADLAVTNFDSDNVSILLNFTPSADLAVTPNASPDPVTVGNDLTYTFPIYNAGPSLATGVTLVDQLPASVSVKSAAYTTPNRTGSCLVAAGNGVTCAIGPLPYGWITYVTIIVTPQTSGSVTNSATVTANETERSLPPPVSWSFSTARSQSKCTRQAQQRTE